MAKEQLWCRVRIVGPGHEELAAVCLRGSGPPDLDAVEQVARLVLVARRSGCTVRLADACAEMADLVVLVALPVEVEG